MSEKIAFATEDGVRLTNHFGHAPYYQVFTIENGQVTAVEQRPKARHGAEEEHDHHEHPHRSDFAASLFASIRDCRMVVAGSMGSPAYEAARAAGLEVVLTAGDIESALRDYLDGTLKHNPRRVHSPGLHRH